MAASWAEQLQRELSGGGLAVASIPGKGRGLVTTRNFFPGEVIVCQEPYVSTPNKISVGSSCDHCFASGNLRKCSACRVAWYCGSSCQKKEWKLHQLECQAIAVLTEDRKKVLTPTIRLMVRLILRRKLQNDKVIPSSGTDNYNLVDALESHISEVNENQLVLYAQIANLVQLILPSFDLDLKEITHTFSKFACNAHTICDPELRPLGTGLYPVISIINHSCAPNAVLLFEGRTAYVRTLQPISKNTEVSISYIETAAATLKRQNDLKQYFFTCTCPRCVEDSVEDALLEGYRCKDQKCDGFLLPDILSVCSMLMTVHFSFMLTRTPLGRVIQQIVILSQVHLVLKELVRRSIAATEELKRFPTLQTDIAAAANESLERFREDGRKTVIRLVEMEASYLTVEFFRKLPTEPDKGANNNTPANDRYQDNHLRRIGSNVSSYINMVCETLKNTIPKTVVHCQVKEAKRNLLNRFYAHVGSKEKKQLSAMLDEDPALMEKRDALVKRLELYKSARNEIDSVAWK